MLTTETLHSRATKKPVGVKVVAVFIDRLLKINEIKLNNYITSVINTWCCRNSL